MLSLSQHCSIPSIHQFGRRYGNGQNYDEQGQDAPDDDYPENGCGGFGGEYFWYMGRTQCFKANVAYSLYGVLKSDSSASSDSSVCNKHTYINSFFTTFGPESFTGPLGLGVDTINSYCNTDQEPENMYLNADDVAADDDYLDDGYLFYDYKSFTSYGTGCAKDGSFVTDSYSGAFCHGKNYQSTRDTLSDFNAQLRGMECTQIYSDGAEAEVYDMENQDDDGGHDFEEMDAINLLTFSKSCSLRQYPNDCPDPYGLKKKYARAVHNAFYLKGAGTRHGFVQHALRAGTILLTIAGCIALCLARSVHQRVTAQQNRATPFDDDSTVTSSKSGKSSRKRRKKSSSRRNRDRTRSKDGKSPAAPTKAVELTASEEPPPTNDKDESFSPDWTTLEVVSPQREILDVPVGDRVERVAISQTGIRSQPWVGSGDGSGDSSGRQQRSKQHRSRAGAFSKFFSKT